MKMGESKSFCVMIDQKLVQSFADFSGDYNPIHVDAGVGSRSEYKGCIAHGALLLSFVSRMLGMELPGPGCVILRQEVQFPKALKAPAEILVEAKLVHFNEERKDGKVEVTVSSHQGTHVLTHVYFMLHHQTSETLSIKSLPDVGNVFPKPKKEGGVNKLLITGGTGGVGADIVNILSQHYECLVISRRPLENKKKVHFCKLDLESEESLRSVLSDLNPADFWGIVHMSSLVPVERRLLGSIEEMKKHFHHSVELPLSFAGWASQNQSNVHRMILLGSTAGSKHLEKSMPGYSLAKSCMGPLVQLLAPELSRLKITINVVSPGFIPAGINAGTPERKQTALAGMTPTGKLTSPNDIASVITFLLSPEASQVNGSNITVDGGIL
ncbi:MAG: SDR family oxidoreductase [Deltaproteobacteria bacterium]|nr:SDR family oxidoreductase [Deltaproteobacteria bacterium]